MSVFNTVSHYARQFRGELDHCVAVVATRYAMPAVGRLQSVIDKCAEECARQMADWVSIIWNYRHSLSSIP